MSRHTQTIAHLRALEAAFSRTAEKMEWGGDGLRDRGKLEAAASSYQVAANLYGMAEAHSAAAEYLEEQQADEEAKLYGGPNG